LGSFFGRGFPFQIPHFAHSRQTPPTLPFAGRPGGMCHSENSYPFTFFFSLLPVFFFHSRTSSPTFLLGDSLCTINLLSCLLPRCIGPLLARLSLLFSSSARSRRSIGSSVRTFVFEPERHFPSFCCWQGSRFVFFVSLVFQDALDQCF